MDIARTCLETGESFQISDDDQAFLERISPVINGRILQIPPPHLSPLARLQRRSAHTNQLYVYSRNSSATGKPIFSMFPEDVPFPVYENELWWSDSWDALQYGRTFDFSRGFFEQFNELSRVVPRYARMVLNVDNCDYCNNISACKNCYLTFNTRHAEDCFNCENVLGSRDCLDCSYSAACELCFDCVTCDRCYAVQSSLDCEDCRDSFFLLNCRACSHCFGCVNLRRREYCIFNEQHTKEAYFNFLEKLKLGSYRGREAVAEQAQAFWREHPRPHAVTSMVQNVSGNYIFQSREVFDSTLIRTGESLRYCFNLFENVKDCYDYSSYGHNAELIYECARCGNDISRLLFCYSCYNNCTDLLYCSFCSASEHCFGCVGLNKKRYCLFNQQYSKDEYFSLVGRIVAHMQQTGEWGEFFPISTSPFPYNHSLAQRYFPKTPAEAAQAGLWYYGKQSPGDGTFVDSSALPDELPEDDNHLVTKSLRSEKPFRIPREEIRRLRAFNAPLPRLTYDERMNARASKLEGIELFEQQCAKTGTRVMTPFPPNSGWIIWDRSEYDQEFSS